MQLLRRPTLCIRLRASGKPRNAHSGLEVVTATTDGAEQPQATSTNLAQGCGSVEWFLSFRRIDLSRVGMEKDAWAVRRVAEMSVHQGQAEPNAGERLDSLKPCRQILFMNGR